MGAHPAASRLRAVAPVVDCLPLGPLGTNCYLVRASEGAAEAVVVDPSGTAAEITGALTACGARCVAILVTHGHFDHVLGVADLVRATGAPVYMARGECFLLEEPREVWGVTVEAQAVDVRLADEGGERLDLAGVSFETVAVPGHSPTHLAFAVEGALLSGDVLFQGSVGRTDLPGADWATLLASIRTLVGRFSADTTVHPGHGPSTTLGVEFATNPFLAELRGEQARA